jgi:hypothetical protein
MMALVGLFKQKSEGVSIRSCHSSLFAIPASFLTFARGKGDREKGIDNTRNTRFRIGSMNKMFTAVATLAGMTNSGSEPESVEVANRSKG